jgi:hypothetical protein
MPSYGPDTAETRVRFLFLSSFLDLSSKKWEEEKE